MLFPWLTGRTRNTLFIFSLLQQLPWNVKRRTWWISSLRVVLESHVRTRASQKVGLLVRLRNLILCNAKLMLYNMSILPCLTYCHIVWKFCKSSKSRKIERIQKRALRAVYKSQNETYEELLIRGKLPNFMASRCLFELFMIKSTHHPWETVILNYPALIQWPMAARQRTFHLVKGRYLWAQKLDKPQSI